MKLVGRLVLLGFFLAAFPAAAQDGTSLYRVADVAVDVTSANAAQARDEAILQAQRLAFGQLLGRLGSGNIPLTDDELALSVSSFEVQKEHASGQRYTGTMTVAFKPEIVRQLLQGKGAAYTEERARPLVVLPVAVAKGRPLLWDDRTVWRNAWEEAARKAALVPMIVPEGDLGDIAQISAQEAVDGKAENLKALAAKHKAGGVLIAVLKTEASFEEAQIEGEMEVRAYDGDGEKREDFEIRLVPHEGAKNLEDQMKEGAAQIVARVEDEWRKAKTQAAQPSVVAPLPPSADRPVFLPVDVPVPSLAVWGQIRNKLSHIPTVAGAHVVTMTRGLVHIELQFHGDMAALQTALAAAGLRLEQGMAGNWEIRQNAL